MSIKLPQPLVTDLDLSGSIGAIGPLTVQGIPTTVTIDLGPVPKIQLGVDALTLNPLNIDPFTVTLDVPTIPAITLNPIQLSLAITQIPSVRAHLPSNYCVGFSLLGVELFSLRLCGESQVITEPYRPNPCEICGPADLSTDIPIKDIPTKVQTGK